MRAAFVVQHLLNELEAWKVPCADTQVIRAACVAVGYRGHAQVLERSDPLRKDGRDGRVPLRIDAANSARAVIHVEVAGDELVLRLNLQWSHCPAHEVG